MKYILFTGRNQKKCLEAQQWLKNHQIAFVIRDGIEHPFTREELQDYLKKTKKRAKKLFNKKCEQYELMQLDEKLEILDERAKTDLLIQNPELLKFPILVGEDKLLAGYKEKKWTEKLLGGKSGQEKEKKGTQDYPEEIQDWEYMSEFYNQEERTVRTLEEISQEIREESHQITEESTTVLSPELAKTLQDVKDVKAESLQGGTIQEIAGRLNLTEEYVTVILMTIEGYAEDTDLAIAHMVMLG